MYYGATGRTVKGLTGAILRKPPEIEYPGVEKDKTDVLDDVGRGGEGLMMIVQQGLEEVLTLGRVGVLVDAPEGDNGDPYITLYFAENIINWREELLPDPVTKKERMQLTLVVLQETVLVPSVETDNEDGNDDENQDNEPGDDFELEEEERWRVLRLIDGEYSVRVYRKQSEKTDKKDAQFELVGEVLTPSFKGGKKPNYIPFTFIRPGGTDAAIEKPPVLDLADVNLSHYRTSADLEHGRHFTALPTPWVAGFDPKESKLRIGSGVAWVSENPQAHCGMLEFTGAGLGHLQTALTEKQSLMAVLGARLLEEQPDVQETATAVSVRHAGERSVLVTIANSVGEAFEKVLGWLANWSATSGDVKFVLNQTFTATQLDAPTLTTLFQALQGDKVSFETWFNYLQRCEIYPEDWTLEEEKDAIAGGPPMSPAGELTHEQNDLHTQQLQHQVDNPPPGKPVAGGPVK